MDSLHEALREQYRRQFMMLREALADNDDQRLRAGQGLLVPARLLVHILWTSAFYLHDEPDYSVFATGRSSNWKEAATEDLPTAARMAEFLAEVEAAFETWLAAKSAADLGAPTRFPWTGASVLDQLLYNLRHSQQHIGEINAILRAADAPRISWQ
jgi:hypothetical protein